VSERNRLIRAMVGGHHDLEEAYRYSPEFQAQVTVIADMLPIVLKALAEEAYIGHKRRTQAYEQLAYNPGSVTFIPDEMIETLRTGPKPTQVEEMIQADQRIPEDMKQKTDPDIELMGS
jgi:hypothetical protein